MFPQSAAIRLNDAPGFNAANCDFGAPGGSVAYSGRLWFGLLGCQETAPSEYPGGASTDLAGRPLRLQERVKTETLWGRRR